MNSRLQRRFLVEHIPYRLKNLGLFAHLIRLGLYSRAKPLPLTILDEQGRAIISGNHRALSNPVAEIGLMECRVMLEFLGLRIDKGGKLVPRISKEPDDVWLADFSTKKIQISNPTPRKFFKISQLRREATLRALRLVYKNANKAIAHLTRGPRYDRNSFMKFAAACEIISEATCQLLYDELQRKRPEWRPIIVKPSTQTP